MRNCGRGVRAPLRWDPDAVGVGRRRFAPGWLAMQKIGCRGSGSAVARDAQCENDLSTRKGPAPADDRAGVLTTRWRRAHQIKQFIAEEARATRENRSPSTGRVMAAPRRMRRCRSPAPQCHGGGDFAALSRPIRSGMVAAGYMRIRIIVRGAKPGELEDKEQDY